MPDRSLSPSEFPLLASPVTPPPAVYPWDEPSQMQDDAARAALVGISLDSLKDMYASRLERTIEAIERRNSLYSSAIQDRKDLLSFQLIDNEASHKTLKAARDEARKALPDLQRLDKEMDSRVRGLLLTILAKWDQFKARHDHELFARNHQRQLEEMAAQKEVAESRACAARQDRETNSDSVTRAESDAAANVISAGESVRQARDACRKLLEMGLTPTVARFLTWVPVLSFVVAGALLAPPSSSPRPAFADEKTPYSLLQNLLGATRPDLLTLFGHYAGFLTAIVLLMISALLGAFWLLGRLDPLRERSPRLDSGYARVNETGGVPSVRPLDLLVSAGRFRMKARLALMRCVPLLPLVLAIGVTVFLNGVTTLSAQIIPGGSPSMEPAMNGALFAASVASSGAMFWFFVLRPSLSKESVAREARLFYVELFMAPFAVLAAAETLPVLEKLMTVALVGVFALAVSITLAHGVYLRGIFARAQVAVSEQDGLRTILSLAVRLPVAADFMPAPPAPLAPAIRWSEAFPWRFRWRFWPRAAVAEIHLSEDEQIKALIKDAHVPSDLVDAINAAFMEREAARSNRSSAEAEHARLEQELSRVSIAIAADREELGRLQRIEVEVLDAHGFLVLRLQTEFEGIMQALEDAYQVARASVAGAPRSASQ